MVRRRKRQFWGIGTIAFLLMATAVAVGINTDTASAETAALVPASGTICAVVTDANTTDPLSGYWVAAEFNGGAYIGSAATGVDGKACFQAAGDSVLVDLRVYGDGVYLEKTESGTLLAGQVVDVPIALDLILPGSISGRVTQEGSGTPIPSIDVQASTTYGDTFSTTTATDGTYMFSDLPAEDSYFIRFSDPSAVFGTEWYDNVLEPGQSVDVPSGTAVAGIDAALGLAGSIAGRVTDQTSGDPLEGIEVSVLGRWYSTRQSMTLTNANGEYTVGGLAAGDYYLRFKGARYQDEWWNDTRDPTSADVVAVATDTTTVGIDASLYPRSGVSGRVYDDRTGQGLPTRVSSRSTAAGTDPWDVWVAIPDALGYYGLERTVGQYEVWSSYGGVELFRSDVLCQDPVPPVDITDGVTLGIDFILRAFCDVDSSDWFFGSVEAIAAGGITDGYPDRSYRPGNTLTRAEMAAFLVKALGETPTLPTVDPFSDVPKGEWYAGYVERLKQLGYTNGYPDGTYRPNSTVTRAETAAFLIKALGETPTVPTVDPFTDVPTGLWYAGYVDRLKLLGITSGYPDGTFRPDSTINRAEIAAFLERSFIP